MNPFEMVAVIVIVVTLGRVLQARYGGVGSKRGEAPFFRDDGATRAENDRLRDEVRGMKERLAVLERLATDKEDVGSRLDREIEKLRERP